MFKKQLLPIILVLAMILPGCASEEMASGEALIQSNSKVSQVKFTQEELDDLTQKAEYAMVAATLRVQESYNNITSGSPSIPKAHLGDLDQDGVMELVYGYDALTFDISSGYNANIVWKECGSLFMLDKDGNLYTYNALGDTDEVDGYWYSDYFTWYETWDGEQWNIVMDNHTKAKEINTGNGDGVDREIVEFSGNIDGKSVSQETWDDHMDDLALTQADTTSRDFTAIAMEKKHRNAIQEELFAYLETNHDCGTKISFDADGDKQTETFIAVHNPIQVWEDSLYNDSSYQIQKDWLTYDFDSDYTVILVSDPREDDIVVSAYCVGGYLDISEEEISYDNGFLQVGTTTISVADDATSIQNMSSSKRDHIYDFVSDQLTHEGFVCNGYKWTDLSDTGMGELLCLCEKNGTWYAFLFTCQDGDVSLVWRVELSGAACYLVNWEGKQYLLNYRQWVSTNYGICQNTYGYDLFRFDKEYQQYSVDDQTISYTNNDEDATHISSFFQTFNQYFDDAIVLGDPYKITGKQWADNDDLDSGSMPQTYEEGKLGYVAIEDPASFLNLREGPGTDYDVVLLDPYNKDSFVRQALGAPVTILDEIYTGDEENPEWVKIRILYEGRQVIGYSSKRFIRVVE